MRRAAIRRSARFRRRHRHGVRFSELVVRIHHQRRIEPTCGQMRVVLIASNRLDIGGFGSKALLQFRMAIGFTSTAYTRPSGPTTSASRSVLSPDPERCRPNLETARSSRRGGHAVRRLSPGIRIRYLSGTVSQRSSRTAPDAVTKLTGDLQRGGSYGARRATAARLWGCGSTASLSTWSAGSDEFLSQSPRPAAVRSLTGSRIVT